MIKSQRLFMYGSNFYESDVVSAYEPKHHSVHPMKTEKIEDYRFGLDQNGIKSTAF